MYSKKGVVVQFGARNKYLVASFLQQQGLLHELHTDIWLNENYRKITKAISPIFNQVRRFENRYNKNIPNEKVITYEKIGFEYLLKRFVNTSTSSYVNNELNATKKFLKAVANKLQKYDGIIYSLREALEVFESADCAYKIMEEVSAIGIYREVIKNENEKWSGWEKFNEKIDNELWDEILNREKQSYSKSNLIIAPSTWVKQYITKLGIPENKIKLIPYWCPSPFDVKEKIFDGSRKLRVLFVGRVNLAKGIPYLIEAIKKLKTNIEVVIVGENFLNLKEIGTIPNNVRFISHSPSSEIEKLYQWADVFVFPTLCEGSSLSVYEALSYGLPIITTPNSGSIVSHEREGYIIEPANSDAIAFHINKILESPSLIKTFSINSLKLAKSNTIEAYRKRLVKVFDDIV